MPCLFLGDDLTNVAPIASPAFTSVHASGSYANRRGSTHPRMAEIMRYERRCRTRRGPLFIASPYAAKLDDIARQLPIKLRRTIWRGWASPSHMRSTFLHQR